MTVTNSDTTPHRELSLLSLVIPIFNEEETIPHLRKATEGWRKTVNVPIELILVNDGSSDRSWTLLVEWAREDSSVRGIDLSRNFGHQAAVTAGLSYAKGDAVVIIDADLQDPLEVINDMLVRYDDGFDVIYGVRISRTGESLLKLTTAWLFYRFMRLLVWKGLPQDAGDFRLVSRRCLDVVLSMDEVHRFLRGMIAWAGFRQTSIQYHRLKREHGISKYPLAKMLNFAWNAALSFSILPIRAISISGLLVAGFGFAYGLFSILRYFIFQDTVPGWTTIIVLLGVIGGMILIGLGVIGEYVGRIYEEIKHRPLYVVQECVNAEVVQHGIRPKQIALFARKSVS
jgi:polyisoprenyl-phosphate glycosyltransferase